MRRRSRNSKKPVVIAKPIIEIAPKPVQEVIEPPVQIIEEPPVQLVKEKVSIPKKPPKKPKIK